jgi:hypothetical protein
VSRDLEDCLARLALYAEAGADMVFPTLVGPAELAEVRRRIDKPAMIVDMPGSLDEHRGAAIVLYYAFPDPGAARGASARSGLPIRQTAWWPGGIGKLPGIPLIGV